MIKVSWIKQKDFLLSDHQLAKLSIQQGRREKGAIPGTKKKLCKIKKHKTFIRE